MANAEVEFSVDARDYPALLPYAQYGYGYDDGTEHLEVQVMVDAAGVIRAYDADRRHYSVLLLDAEVEAAIRAVAATHRARH